MNLVEEFGQRLKSAMKRRDAGELALLRMIKTRFQMKLSEKGVTGPLDDEMARSIIVTYSKQMSKSIADFKKAGERGLDKLKQIEYEVEYLKQFLPQMMNETQTAKIVTDKIAELGISQPTQAGMLMGAIMKEYKGKIDAGLTKQLVTKALTPKPE